MKMTSYITVTDVKSQWLGQLGFEHYVLTFAGGDSDDIPGFC